MAAGRYESALGDRRIARAAGNLAVNNMVKYLNSQHDGGSNEQQNCNLRDRQLHRLARFEGKLKFHMLRILLGSIGMNNFQIMQTRP